MSFGKQRPAIERVETAAGGRGQIELPASLGLARIPPDGGRFGAVVGIDELAEARPPQLLSNEASRTSEGDVGVRDPARGLQQEYLLREEVGCSTPGRFVQEHAGAIRGSRAFGGRGGSRQAALTLQRAHLERDAARAGQVLHPLQHLNVVQTVAPVSGAGALRPGHLVAALPDADGVRGQPDHHGHFADGERRLFAHWATSFLASTTLTRASTPCPSAPTRRHRPGTRLKAAPPTRTGMRRAFTRSTDWRMARTLGK